MGIYDAFKDALNVAQKADNTQFPDDYRSKNEIIKGIELSQKEPPLEEN